MYEQPIDEALFYYLDKKVIAEDVKYAYYCIEKINNSNDEVKELEKQILINSFYNNRILFNSRVYYNSFSTLVFRIGYNYGTKKLEQTSEIMNSIQNIIFNIDEFDIQDKYQLLNIICINYEFLYEQFIKDKQNIKSIFSSIFNEIYQKIDENYLDDKIYKYEYKIS